MNYLLSPLCKSTAKLQLFAHICKYFGQKLQIFYLFRQFTPLSLVQYIGFLGHYGPKRKNNSFDSYNSYLVSLERFFRRFIFFESEVKRNAFLVY